MRRRKVGLYQEELGKEGESITQSIDVNWWRLSGYTATTNLIQSLSANLLSSFISFSRWLVLRMFSFSFLSYRSFFNFLFAPGKLSFFFYCEDDKEKSQLKGS